MKKQIPVELILKLHDEEKLNPSQIGVRLGFAKDTIKSHLIKNGRVPYKKAEGVKSSAYQEFIDTLKKDPNASFTHLRKKLKISHEFAIKLIEENNIVVNKMAVRHLSIEEAQSRVPKGAGTVVSREPDGTYKIVMDDGYIYYKASSKLEQGDPRKMDRDTEEEIRAELKKVGYDLTKFVSYTKQRTTFVNKRKSMSAVCLKCKNERTCPYRLFFTNPCSGCTGHGSSFAEEQLGMWIKSIGINFTKKRFPRGIGQGKGRGKEIDIYIEDKNIGIEYCGLYWHNENSKTPRDRMYHINKMDMANKLGIRLIQVFEDEWLQKRSAVKNRIKSILGIYSEKFYARKCEVRLIEKEVARVFLNTNHIQDAEKITQAFGIFLGDRLLGVMTAAPHPRQNNPAEITLARLAFDGNIQIVGGASKLFNLFKKWAIDQGYKKIISWSDNRWSEGKVYSSLSFKLSHISAPDYSYVVRQSPKHCIRKSKYSCNKDALRKLGAIGETESEMAKSLNYNKIWDCGKKTWIYELP